MACNVVEEADGGQAGAGGVRLGGDNEVAVSGMLYCDMGSWSSNLGICRKICEVAVWNAGQLTRVHEDESAPLRLQISVLTCSYLRM